MLFARQIRTPTKYTNQKVQCCCQHKYPICTGVIFEDRFTFYHLYNPKVHEYLVIGVNSYGVTQGNGDILVLVYDILNYLDRISGYSISIMEFSIDYSSKRSQVLCQLLVIP